MAGLLELLQIGFFVGDALVGVLTVLNPALIETHEDVRSGDLCLLQLAPRKGADLKEVFHVQIHVSIHVDNHNVGHCQTSQRDLAVKLGVIFL